MEYQAEQLEGMCMVSWVGLGFVRWATGSSITKQSLLPQAHSFTLGVWELLHPL